MPKRQGRNRIGDIARFVVICAVVALAASATTAWAQTSIYSDPGDGELLPTGASNNTTSTVARVGTGHVSGPSGGRDAVYAFLLPTLTAGQQIKTANLAIALDSFSSTGLFTYNVDLYGAGIFSTPTISQVGFYVGPSDPSPSVSLIQDNFATTASPTFASGGTLNTSTSGATALVSYLNSLYAAGATGGQYAFFRLTPDYATDPAPTTSTGYNFRTVEIGAGNGRPTLTYTLGGAAATPEPASVGLVVLGAGGLAGTLRSRRRRA